MTLQLREIRNPESDDGRARESFKVTPVTVEDEPTAFELSEVLLIVLAGIAILLTVSALVLSSVTVG
jgi:hypothetical protein